MRTHLQRLSLSVTLVVLLLGGPAAQAAPTFVVNSPSDVVGLNPGNQVCETGPGNKTCTLRRAILEANHTPGGGAIVDLRAVPGGVVMLTIAPAGLNDETTGDLNITANMSIIGAAASTTIIDGNALDRVFSIAGGVRVDIDSITIRNGQPASGGVGGVFNDTDSLLTLRHSAVSGNIGGGVENRGTLTLVNSTVSGNKETFIDPQTALLGGGAGGIVNAFGTVTITNSTVSNNSRTVKVLSCQDCGGGGIRNLGTMSIINSTVSGNVLTINASTCTECGGGGINNGFGELTLINSTVSGNETNIDGGGLFRRGGTTIGVFNSTITQNTAGLDRTGGGVFSSGSGFTFQNTILAGNHAPHTLILVPAIILPPISFLVDDDCAGTLVSNGNNLMGVKNCTVTGVAPTLADPQLGSLQNNGGPTATHALLAGSPAIDAGTPTGCRDNLGALLSTDQRGATRPFDGNGDGTGQCDIGAFEVAPGAVPVVAAVLPSSRSVQVGTAATAFATVINNGTTAAFGVGISFGTSLPATLTYRTTDPATNAVTGAPDAPADIPPGHNQTYVIAVTPTAPFPPTDVAFNFAGSNTLPAGTLTGVNTLLLTASSVPVPDIVALAVTVTNDGIVNIPGPTGNAAFAVATVNVGANSSITVTADTGGVTLPVLLFVCQTNPANGQCLAPGPAASVTLQISTNATPTFGVFVAGQGIVPFDPAANRVFVRFKDPGNVIRGSTSVAVRTQ